MGPLGSALVWLGPVESDLGLLWVWFTTFTAFWIQNSPKNIFDTGVAREQFVNFYSFKLKIKFLLQKKWNEVHRVCVLSPGHESYNES